MKKYISILLLSILCTGALMTSCVDLDSDKYFADRKTLEFVFTDKDQSEQWLAHAYSFLTGCNFEVCSKGGTGGTGGDWNPFCFADDIYYGDRDNAYGDHKDADYASYNSFREGNYNEEVGYNAWIKCYKGIYQASIFIHNIDQLAGHDDMSELDVLDMRGQARFVRAYYYWLLLRKFGPVPIMPDEGADYTDSYDDLAIPRSTYEEVANYISDEMIKAAEEIQYTRRDANSIARPTKGACLATRAIVYTYAASPLANGQLANGQHPAGVTDDAARSLRNFDGTQLLSLTYDESKWARAAAACKDVMELGVYDLYHVPATTSASDGYPATVPPFDDGNFSTQNWPYGYADIDPMKSYRQIFDGDVTPPENYELIFSRVSNMAVGDNDNGIGALVLHEMPTQRGGWNTHGMTQKMCDTYYMNDGTDVDGMYSEWAPEKGNDRPRATGWTARADVRKGLYPELAVRASSTDGVDVSMQYIGREPRFYASVGYSGAIWEGVGNTTSSQRWYQCFYYRGSGNGYVNNFNYPRTGIGIKKWYHPYDYSESTSNGYAHIRAKYETAIRYADILLMYAECLNELKGSYTIPSWDGKTTYTISRNVADIRKGTHPVRIRAGLPDYADDVYADADLLRAKIKRERMIELMGEGKRYFDLRRWMDAPIEENTLIYGLNVFQTKTNKDEFMQVIPCFNLSSVFADKMYFWPISHTELKRNKNLVQNPGWTYND